MSSFDPMSRVDVWHAMSDLYLDSEIDHLDLLMVAEKLAATAYSSEQLDWIFYQEVHPVLCWNLAIPAGIWGCFDKEQLNTIITEYLNRGKKASWFKRLQENVRRKEIKRLEELVKIDWEKTILLVDLIREKRISCLP